MSGWWTVDDLTVTNKRIVLTMWLVVVLLAGVTAALVMTLGWPGGETTTVEVERQAEPKPTAGAQVTTTTLVAEEGSTARAVIWRDGTCVQSLTLEPVEPGTVRSGCAATHPTRALSHSLRAVDAIANRMVDAWAAWSVGFPLGQAVRA